MEPSLSRFLASFMKGSQSTHLTNKACKKNVVMLVSTILCMYKATE